MGETIATYEPRQLDFWAYMVFSELLPWHMDGKRWVRVELSPLGLTVTVACHWVVLPWAWYRAWKTALRHRSLLNVWAPIYVHGVAV